MQRARLISICLLLGVAASAFGQILPPVQVPTLPGLPTDQIDRTVNDTVNGTLRTADPQQLREVRRLRIRELLRTNRAGLEADPRGAPMVRSEVVALSPSPAALESARAEGFTVGRTRTLDGLDATIVVLQAPTGISTRRALQRLRQLDPGGVYDFNHVYLDSGTVADGAAELRGWAFVAVASAPRPVPTATPAGPERTASCFVFEPVVFVLVAVDVADERASLLVAPGAFCASEPVLEALVPAVPPGSSAHATPLFHPVRMATPTTKATTKPPTRPTYASLGMRYVYRLGSLGVPGMSETRQFADCCRPRLASRRICRARKRMSVM